MRYRRFGVLDWKVSALGFGIMRMPIIDGNRASIDEPEGIKMIHYAIDHGVNYIDTAYPYHDGSSEVLLGKALKDGYREKVKLATKMPTWLVNSREDMDRFFEEQLERLQTSYVDFYLLHGLKEDRWNKVKELNVFQWLERQIDDGRIKHLGFSFHDKYEIFKDIVDGYDGWTLCQIQYNYMDVDYQAGTRGLKYAASKGLAVVVMEPLLGGTLASKPPDEIQAIWDEAAVERTPAEWGLQWVWNHPEVSVVLSGMSTMRQVIENVESTSRSGPGKLTQDELDLISRVRSKYEKYGAVGCSGCRYCIPCPEGVDIPEIFKWYNEYLIENRDSKVIEKYLEAMPEENRAKRCARCGQCEDKCPQQIPIRNLLNHVALTFEE